MLLLNEKLFLDAVLIKIFLFRTIYMKIYPFGIVIQNLGKAQAFWALPAMAPLPCIEKSMLYKVQKVTFIIVNAK